jgi:hypothetical protein
MFVCVAKKKKSCKTANAFSFTPKYTFYKKDETDSIVHKGGVLLFCKVGDKCDVIILNTDVLDVFFFIMNQNATVVR